MTWLESLADSFILWVQKNRVPAPIGPKYDPTYDRYYVWPRNRFLNLYAHQWFHDDLQHPHDHRMANVSLILWGSYSEEVFVHRPRQNSPLPATRIVRLRRWRLKFRRATTAHRVVLDRADGAPAWSLFLGLPHLRGWGFWCPGKGSARWLPEKVYLRTRAGKTDYSYTADDPIVGCEE